MSDYEHATFNLPQIDGEDWDNRRWQGRCYAVGGAIAQSLHNIHLLKQSHIFSLANYNWQGYDKHLGIGDDDSAYMEYTIHDLMLTDALEILKQQIETASQCEDKKDITYAEYTGELKGILRSLQAAFRSEMLLGRLWVFSHVAYERIMGIPVDSPANIDRRVDQMVPWFNEECETLRTMLEDALTNMEDQETTRSRNNMFFWLKNNVSLDLPIIERALTQRTGFAFDLHDSLIASDFVAELSLAPAKAQNLLPYDDPQVVTFLNERVMVRLLPYEDTIYIGVPYSASIKQVRKLDPEVFPNRPQEYEEVTLPVSHDYLAIPHEVGHFVYQQGHLPNSENTVQTDLVARLQDINFDGDPAFNTAFRTLCETWLEEIFSDAYGCLVAGPIAVWGFQTLLIDGWASDHRLLDEVDVHPDDRLRALIQSEILRQIGQRIDAPNYAAAADMFDTHWLEEVQEENMAMTQAHIMQNNQYTIHGDRTLNGQSLLTLLQPVIIMILDALQAEDFAQSWTPNWQPSPSNKRDALTNMYHEFATYICNKVNESRTITVEQVDELIALQEQKQTASESFEWLKHHLVDLKTVDELVEIVFGLWGDKGPERDDPG
ncbi:MAG: hypothetical protein AAF629_31060 [Chloroflexota bacterium]